MHGHAADADWQIGTNNQGRLPQQICIQVFFTMGHDPAAADRATLKPFNASKRKYI
jgi:hypothetical protein